MNRGEITGRKLPGESSGEITGGKLPGGITGGKSPGEFICFGSSAGRGPCDLRMQSANREEAHVANTRSRGAPIASRWFRMTPNTRKASTRSAPEMKGSEEHWVYDHNDGKRI